MFCYTSHTNRTPRFFTNSMQWGVKSKLILCNIDRVEILNKKLWHTSKKENKLIATLKKSEKDCQPKMEAKTILL